MVPYLIPFFFLTAFAYLEHFNKFISTLRNKTFYTILTLTLIFFIGFRFQVGCDWETYEFNFNKLALKDITEILQNPRKLVDIPYSVVVKTLSYFFDYKSQFVFYSIFFTVPLFVFAYQIKRTYLSLMLSYPYFIVVVGMGPIRQAAAISLFAMSINFISSKKYKYFYLSNFFASFFHHSSLIINSINLIFYDFLINKPKRKKINYLIYFLIFILFFYNFQFIYEKLIAYIRLNNSQGYSARSAFLIWIINFIPAFIYLLYQVKFKFEAGLRKIVMLFSILEIMILPFVFLNSVITYRLLLYFFPFSILILSNIKDLFFSKKTALIFLNSITFICFSSLVFWLNYSNHSYCWVPYKNFLLFD